MGTTVIETRALTRYYGRVVGVDDLNLEVMPGEVFGFLGPNGSGKTTTIRLLLDLIRPSRGEAFLFGHSASIPEVRGRLGYLPGELSLDGRMTGEATLQFLDGLLLVRSDPKTRHELCERLNLSHNDLRRPVREYSRGMKQKIGLVSAFQHRPALIVLDEPTTSLDPLVREVVFDMMAETKSSGATVFHSSHVLSEVDRTCDRVAILKQGRLAALMRVEEVRRASARRMVVEFDHDVPLHDVTLPGVQVLESGGRRLVLLVTGAPDELLRALARHRVTYLAFPESNLEEAFANYYRSDAGNNR